MIKLGSTDITNVMLGTTKVDAIFLGRYESVSKSTCSRRNICISRG